MGTVQAKEEEEQEGLGSSTEEEEVDDEDSLVPPSPNLHDGSGSGSHPRQPHSHASHALESGDDQRGLTSNGAGAATAASVVEGPLSKKDALQTGFSDVPEKSHGGGEHSSNLFAASRSKKRSAFHEPQHRSQGANAVTNALNANSENASNSNSVPLPSIALKENNSSVISETNDKVQELQPPDDGYKWRKYGRKMVKGNQFPRSYYKCVESNCPVRKYTEATQDEAGVIHVKSFYSGEHKHAVAHLVTRVQAQDQTSFKNSVRTGPTESKATVKTNSPTTTTTTTAATKTNNTGAEKETNGASNYTSRLVVETNDDVDFLDDGYNWRKYGQKNVKGTKSLRSYYKCTTAGCKMKKYVEKQGDKIVNVYEGQHNHPAPDNDSFSILPRKKRRRYPANNNNNSNDAVTHITVPLPTAPSATATTTS